MALNRQVIRQKEEELKQKLEFADQPKSKSEFAVYLYFYQMREKFPLGTKTSSLRSKDLPQQLGERTSKKSPKQLHLVRQLNE